MSIKAKIIVVVAATLLMGAVATGYLFHRDYSQHVAHTSAEALRASRGAFENLHKDSVDMLAAAVEALASNQEINAALAKRDRESLLRASAPLLANYHKRYGITHWLYWEPEPAGEADVKGLVSFLRTSFPEKHGEMVERVMLSQVARTKTLVDGLDLGNTGFALRVVAPLYWKGQLCGYFELGKDIGSFMDNMKHQTGNEYGMMLKKASMDAAKWRSSRASLGQRDNWDDMQDLVVAQNTYADDSILTYKDDLDGVPVSGRQLGLLEHDARMYSRGVFPVYAAGGGKVGAVFVLSDITDIYRAARQDAFGGIIAIAVLMSLTGIVMCLLFNRLIVSRLERLIRIATRVVGGEFTLEVVPSARDEVGRFEELFEQFRRVFVDLIQNADASPEHGPQSEVAGISRIGAK